MDKKIITGDTLIIDVIDVNPNAAEIFQKYDMHCLGCAIAHGESVAEAAEVHGIDLQKLLEDLNK